MITNLSFSTTATLRPAIMDQAYSSLGRLKNIDFSTTTLYLNVDPCPQDLCDPMEVVNVAKKYFGNVVYNIPKSPNFSAAINWLWSQAQSEFLFHLEDDRVWIKDVNLVEALRKFVSLPHLLMLRFRYKRPGKSFSYGLTPSIMRKSFYKAFAGKLNITQNPESQLYKPTQFGLPVPKIDKNLIQWPDKICVVDIGREWREANNIKLLQHDKKDGDLKTFVYWTKGV